MAKNKLDQKNFFQRVIQNILGDWKGSLKFEMYFFIPILILAFLAFINGWYPNGSKVLNERGWNAGFFRDHLNLFVYIIFYFGLFIPLEELIFRKIPLDAIKDNEILEHAVIFSSAIMIGLTRMVYPYPFGVVLSVIIVSVYFGYDYKKHRSLLSLWFFHSLIASIAFSLNIW